jgi:hypothetical protein
MLQLNNHYNLYAFIALNIAQLFRIRNIRFQHQTLRNILEVRHMLLISVSKVLTHRQGTFSWVLKITHFTNIIYNI